MEKIAEHEGHRKHRLQQNAIETERRRDGDLAGAAANLAEFKDGWARRDDNSPHVYFHSDQAAPLMRFRVAPGPSVRGWQPPAQLRDVPRTPRGEKIA